MRKTTNKRVVENVMARSGHYGKGNLSSKRVYHQKEFTVSDGGTAKCSPTYCYNLDEKALWAASRYTSAQLVRFSLPKAAILLFGDRESQFLAQTRRIAASGTRMNW